MIRRLLYHFFWNFYDYLGSSLLLGGGGFLAATLLVLGGGAAASLLPAGVPQMLAAGMVLVLLVGLLGWLLGGFYAFATRAARDEPARMPDFFQGARSLFLPYVKVSAALLILLVVIVSNVAFYLRMGSPVTSAVAMFFVWIALGVLFFAPAALAVPARFPEERRLLPILRRGMMLFALAPTLWVVVTILFLVIAIVGFLSVVGSVFLLPVLSILSATALDLVVRMVDDLGRARAELGEGKPVSAYKRRALELGWEWEYRQPRRTLRELIRPWEH